MSHSLNIEVNEDEMEVKTTLFTEYNLISQATNISNVIVTFDSHIANKCPFFQIVLGFSLCRTVQNCCENESKYLNTKLFNGCKKTRSSTTTHQATY